MDALAQGDVTKYNEVLLIDFTTVITKLYYDKEVADYQKRYMKVMERKGREKTRK